MEEAGSWKEATSMRHMEEGWLLHAKEEELNAARARIVELEHERDTREKAFIALEESYARLKAFTEGVLGIHWTGQQKDHGKGQSEAAIPTEREQASAPNLLRGGSNKKASSDADGASMLQTEQWITRTDGSSEELVEHSHEI